MLVAGLTGGIASGKSTVSNWLAKMGAVVLDADRMAHEAVEKGSIGWQAVVDAFGRQILLSDDRIDRRALARIVFACGEKRKVLEQIIHPIVSNRMKAALNRVSLENPQAVVIQDIPLLFEAGFNKGLDEIIVVYVPEYIQLQRLMARDGLSEAQARARIMSQLSMEDKKRRAGMVIDNSGSLAATRRQTEKVYKYLLGKAGKKDITNNLM